MLVDPQRRALGDEMHAGLDIVRGDGIASEQVGRLRVLGLEVASGGEAIDQHRVSPLTRFQLLGEHDCAGAVVAVGAVGVHVEGERFVGGILMLERAGIHVPDRAEDRRTRVADAFGEANGRLLAEFGAVEGRPTETSEMVERVGPRCVVVEHTEVEPGRLGRRVPQIHTGREGEPGSGTRPKRPTTRRDRQQSVEVVTGTNAIAPVDREPGPVDVHRSRRNLRVDPERVGEALLGVRVKAVDVVAMVAKPSSRDHVLTEHHRTFRNRDSEGSHGPSVPDQRRMRTLPYMVP